MQLLRYPGRLLGGCHGTLGGCYGVARVFGVVARVLLGVC